MHTPTDTTVLLLTGPEATAVEQHRLAFLQQHAELGDTERIDLRDGLDRLIGAMRALDLFGGGRLVDAVGGEVLDTQAVRDIAEAAESSSARVVIRGGDRKPHPAAVKALAAAGEHVHCDLPGPRELPGRIRELAEMHGIELAADGVTVLAERCGHDLARIAGVLRMLQAADLRRPQARQLDLLVGSAAADGVPWSVTDALAAGDARAAVAALERLDAQAVLAWLAKWLSEVGRLAEAGPGADPSAVLGGPAWRTRKLVGPARALGAAGAGAALTDVVETTARARGGDVPASEATAALLVRLAAAFS